LARYVRKSFAHSTTEELPRLTDHCLIMRIGYPIDVSRPLAYSDKRGRLEKDLLKPFTFVFDLRQRAISVLLGSFLGDRC
jgi:hypothetical protein